VAATETYLRWWLQFTHQNARGIGELQARGVTISRTPDDVLTRQLQTWDKIREAEAARDPFFRKVVDSQRQWASVVVQGRRAMFAPYEFSADYYWKKP
jgi:TRAP-type mannitol/chloroaromatic compound transport system substrate-binding protein